MTGGHDRAHVDVFIHRVAGDQTVHPAAQKGFEPFRHGLGHQNAGPCATDLTLIEPDRIDDTLNRRVQIRVGEHDKGGFPAQFQRQVLARSGGGGANGTAHLGRTGERDLINAIVFDQHLPHRAVAGRDVQNPRRQAAFNGNLRKGQRA